MVTDAGPDQQVKIYADITTKPHLESTLGAKGGLFATPIGTFGDKRFNQPKGVGVDAAGNIYVASSGSASGGSTVLECYASDGQLRWRRLGRTFLDCADADPQNAADVYTKEERFTLDYSQPAGKEWAYRGYTVNPFRYPDDPRLHLPSTNAWVRRIEGRKFLFVTDMTSEYLHVYRFQPDTDGETAIPCALFAKRHANHPGAYPPAQPEKGEWLWLDRNGDGRIEADEYQTNHGEDSQGIFVPDEQGTIWQVGGNTLRALPVQPLNAKGAPVWDYAKARTLCRPPNSTKSTAAVSAGEGCHAAGREPRRRQE